MNYSKIRLLIVEDHNAMRDGLKRIFEKIPQVSAIGSTADVESALGELRGPDWDALLVDLMTQGCRALDVVAAARAARPKLPILALCRHGHDLCAARALRSGASGYAAADADSAELARAFLRVVHGARYVSPSLPAWIRNGTDSDRPTPHESLSNREYQVFRMIAAGAMPAQIAAELALSVKTVATYRVRVLKKLGLSTSAELMHYALANGLAQ